MASLRGMLFAGVAVTGIGLAGAASAQTSHVITIPVPGGDVAQIRYFGDVPPQVAFAPAPAAFGGGMPVSSVLGYDMPFAMLDRLAIEMNRRAAALFRYAEAIADRANTGGDFDAAFGAMPAGGGSYSYISTVSGSGVCTQSVRIMSRGDGTPPVVERHSSGNCGTSVGPRGQSGAQPAAPAPAAPKRQPDLILTQSTGGSPYTGMVRHVASAR